MNSNEILALLKPIAKKTAGWDELMPIVHKIREAIKDERLQGVWDVEEWLSVDPKLDGLRINLRNRFKIGEFGTTQTETKETKQS